jgi:lipoic acid synthetase
MRRHPDWLKVKIGGGEQYQKVKTLLRSSQLHTICEEAKCPNIAECFGNGTAVFLILGTVCTRNCRYCNVTHGTPLPLDKKEPRAVAESVQKLGLKYVVVTSVTRDDLDDGGAQAFYETVTEIKKRNGSCKVEVLIPDFNGDKTALSTVMKSAPDVCNHNIEIVEPLFPTLRPRGNYQTSLTLLKTAKEVNGTLLTKSGFMVGLGENTDQVIKTMNDLRTARVDFLTIGQYLQPTRNHARIEKYYTPEEFLELKHIAIDLGFKHVESGPLVRSSYHAEKMFI